MNTTFRGRAVKWPAALLVLAGLWVAAVAANPMPAPPPSPSPTASPTPEATPTPTPQPTPAPNPTINLNQASGPAGSQLVVTGSGFQPGQQINLFVDSPDHPVGPQTTADGAGNFTQTVQMPDGTGQGGHQVCATTGGSSPACAQFQVLPPPASNPTPAPTAAPTATPTAAPTAAPATPPAIQATPQAATSALASLFPWILLPLLVLLALAALAAALIRRNRGPLPGPSRSGGSGIPTVTHRSPQRTGNVVPSEPEYPAGRAVPFADPLAPPAYQPEAELLPPIESPPEVPSLPSGPPVGPAEPLPAPRSTGGALPPARPARRPDQPGEPPRAAGGDDDPDLPEPGD